MGLCMSSSGAAAEAAAAATPRDTALVLLPDGDLREYPRPVTAGRVLDDASSSSAAASGDDWILCDADRIGFEGPVTAVPSPEPLRAGQIYFVLPAAAAGRRGLSREEVAALAVRASAALSRAAAAASASGSGRRRRGAVAPLVFAPPEEEEEVNEVEWTLAQKAAAAQTRLKRRPTPRPGRRLERFASDLMAIPECEMGSE